jgi:hypothetical protein
MRLPICPGNWQNLVHAVVVLCRCAAVNACAPPSGNPCISVVGSTQACADETGDADPPYTCACETGRIWNPEFRQCDGEAPLGPVQMSS